MAGDLPRGCGRAKRFSLHLGQDPHGGRICGPQEPAALGTWCQQESPVSWSGPAQ